MVDWYFDFLSPYAYLQFQRIDELQQAQRGSALRPLLFVGLL